VVPNNQANTPGDMPLRLGGAAVRIQEVVGSGQFTVPIVITGIRLRSAVGTGPVSSNPASVKVTISTTQAYPNTNNGHALPSLTYANNVGPDATTVYNAALSLSSPGCSGPAPCPFDMAVPFTTPFSYDPTKGRLLVDIVSSAVQGTPTGGLDAVLFTDTVNSTVAIVVGDPTQAAGTLNVAGIVLQLDLAAAASGPTVGSVVHAFSFGPQLSPGALAAIFGANFGSGPASSVSVSVGGKSAYVLTVNPTQLNVQIPYEVSPEATTLTVTANGAASAPFNLTLATYAPAILTAGGAGTGPATIFTPKNVMVTLAAPASPGDNLTIFATGLGPTNPPTPTGVVTAANPLVTTPTVTVSGVAAKVLYSGSAPNIGGAIQIVFTVPAGVQGTQPLVLTIGGVSSSASVTVPLFGITSIVNNASFAPASAGTAAPGSFVTIYANGLGSTDQLTGFPATKFQGVQVTFNGIAAPLFHVIATAKPQQIDLLVPNELPTTGTVNVQLTTPTAFYPNYTLNMVPANPGWYRIADPLVKTRSNVIAQFANTVWLALPASTTAALQAPACDSNTNPLSLCGRPATAGDYLVIYATGLGLTTPNGDPNGKALPTGVAPPADGSVLYQTPTLPTVTIGGIATKVLYAGLAPGFPGLYQVDVQVPPGVASGDDVPVVITMGTASDSATISIQPRP
jgi:uncharacterized protein (TIGR03437 family)